MAKTLLGKIGVGINDSLMIPHFQIDVEYIINSAKLIYQTYRNIKTKK